MSVIDDYILEQPTFMQEPLNEIRNAISEVMPDFAEEKISYQMPAFYVHGNCVYFAASKKHIGFYPTSSGIMNFTDEFEKRGLKYSKGAVQFPLGKPMPIDLVKEITKFRVNESIEKYEMKKLMK